MRKRVWSLSGRSRSYRRYQGGDLWLHGTPIYTHVRQHLDSASGRLLPEGFSLPDEERRTAGSQMRWVPGALDSTFGLHSGLTMDKETAHAVAGHVMAIARDGAHASRVDLYRLLVEDDILGFVDSAMREIEHFATPAEPYLHDFARFLATEAPDRGPVKFAIVLLGLIADPNDQDLVALLGLHDEFTLYAAAALANMLPNPEPVLWDLAQKVEGWGRIHTVRQLARTQDPRVKDWLLRRGYRNTIQVEHIAFTCANSGGLRAALAADDVDDELLIAAGVLLRALIRGGLAQDIGDYADAAPATAAYLAHLELRMPEALEHFLAVNAIRDYLSGDRWDDPDTRPDGWPEEVRRTALGAAARILRDPRWPGLAVQGLASPDEDTFYRADQVARLLGIDTWQIHWYRLQEDPVNSARWYHVMGSAKAEHIPHVVAFALRVLPLERVATGPSLEIGMNPRFRLHNCLGTIVARLGDYPLTGWPLIAAALASPVIQNRAAAVYVLVQWGRARWSPEIEQALRAAHGAEPLAKLRKRMEASLG